MSYASLDDLKKRVGERMLVQLTDRAEPATGLIDAAVIADKLRDADAEIDSYLAGRYRLPIAGAVPSRLIDLASAIAIYKLHTYEPDAKIVRDYDRAIADLGKIANGAIRLEIAGAEPQTSGASGVQAVDRERPLSPESLTGFI